MQGMIRGVIWAAGDRVLIWRVGAFAQTAQVDTQTIPAGKVFPFLDTYLGLPPAERDHFRLVYGVTGDGPLENAHLTLKRSSGDVPIQVAADGHILTEPSPADLKSAQVVMTTGPKVRTTAFPCAWSPACHQPRPWTWRSP